MPQLSTGALASVNEMVIFPFTKTPPTKILSYYRRTIKHHCPDDSSTKLVTILLRSTLVRYHLLCPERLPQRSPTATEVPLFHKCHCLSMPELHRHCRGSAGMPLLSYKTIRDKEEAGQQWPSGRNGSWGMNGDSVTRGRSYDKIRSTVSVIKQAQERRFGRSPSF